VIKKPTPPVQQNSIQIKCPNQYHFTYILDNLCVEIDFLFLNW